MAQTDKDWNPISAYVLRNLSKREYVLGQTIVSYAGRWREYFSFGKLLLMCLCWLPNNSLGMVDPTRKMRRGLWAGDRFDMMKAENVHVRPRNVPGVQMEGSWENVSAEVINEY